jgi:hypothetical protein
VDGGRIMLENALFLSALHMAVPPTPCTLAETFIGSVDIPNPVSELACTSDTSVDFDLLFSYCVDSSVGNDTNTIQDISRVEISLGEQLLGNLVLPTIDIVNAVTEALPINYETERFVASVMNDRKKNATRRRI